MRRMQEKWNFFEWLGYELAPLYTNVKLIVLYVFNMIAVYLAPTYASFWVISTLVFADIITALMAVYKESDNFSDFWNNRFKASELKESVFKLISYGILMIISFVLEKSVFETGGILKAFMGLIGTIECKSIIENIDRTLGTKIIDYVVSFLPKIKKTNEKN